MDIKTKARKMGMTVQGVHEAVKRDSTWQGASKVGGKLVFPDPETTLSPSGEPAVYPPEEESRRKKAFFDAEKSRQECLKQTKLNAIAAGDFVERGPMEKHFAVVIGMVRSKVLALPDKLKRMVGDEITERGEMALERLCDDLLKEVAAGGKQVK